MATRKSKALGTAVLVDLAITALRNPTVQDVLKQAPDYLGRFAADVRQRRSGERRQLGARVTEQFGQQKLERRAADIRALLDDLAVMPAGKNIDSATVHKVSAALDAIDLELRLAAHQSWADRLRHHQRIRSQLNALVNALSEPLSS